MCICNRTWNEWKWVESSRASSLVELSWNEFVCLQSMMVSAYASHFQLFPSFFSRISFHFSAAPLTLSLSLLFMYVVIKLYFQLNQMKCDRKDTIIEISMSASHTESESERERDRGRCNTTNVIGPNGKWEFYYVNIYSHTNSKLCVHISY